MAVTTVPGSAGAALVIGIVIDIVITVIVDVAVAVVVIGGGGGGGGAGGGGRGGVGVVGVVGAVVVVAVGCWLLVVVVVVQFPLLLVFLGSSHLRLIAHPSLLASSERYFPDSNLFSNFRLETEGLE